MHIATGLVWDQQLSTKVPSNGDLIEEIRKFLPTTYSTLVGDPITMILCWAYDKYRPDFLSNNLVVMSYYLACNGVKVTLHGSLTDALELIKEYWVSGDVKVLTDIANKFNNISTITFVDVSEDDLSEGLVIGDKIVPAKLVHHLMEKEDAVSVLKEIIRLQTLDTFSMIDSPVQALLSGWDICEEGK